MLVLAILCPPLFFLLSKRWVHFVLSGFVYAVGLVGLPIFGLGLIFLIPDAIYGAYFHHQDVVRLGT